MSDSPARGLDKLQQSQGPRGLTYGREDGKVNQADELRPYTSELHITSDTVGLVPYLIMRLLSCSLSHSRSSEARSNIRR